jgi:DNA-binding SARP family transcriptional activator
VSVRDDRLELDANVEVDLHELRTIAGRLLDDEPAEDAFEQLPVLARSMELLPEWDDDWVVADRERLRLLRLEALEYAAFTLLRRGRIGHALLAAQAAAESEPIRESTRRLIVRAHLARGNVAEAIRAYADYRYLLMSDFQVQPSAAMERLISPWKALAG